MPCLAHMAKNVVCTTDMDSIAEVIAKQNRTDGEPAYNSGRDGKHYQWHCDHSRRLVKMRLLFLAHAFISVEDEEEHTKRIQRCNEYPEQHTKIRDPVDSALPAPMRLLYSFNQKVFREKARRSGEANKRK